VVAERARVRAFLIAILSTSIISCGGSSGPPTGDPDGSPRIDSSTSPQPDAPVSMPDAPIAVRFQCDLPPPAGAPAPVSPPLPAAGCPTLVSGHNTFTSTGHPREFILVLPEDPVAGESYPVMFMWHWIGGDADGFLERGEVQAAVTDQRFIAVIPVAEGAEILGQLDTRWPFDITQTAERMDEEFAFFDDMLACVEAQFAVNTSCVSSVGVSAGALFTDQLAQARSQTLASFTSLSGGVGATWIKPWTGAARPLPSLVLWGGDGPPGMDGVKDILGCFGIGMDFSIASSALEDALTAGGHFFIECKHNCGHVEPPLETPMGQSKYAAMWEFALDHPFWLPAGTSPYLTAGLPPEMPTWCGLGSDGSTPRSGGGCPPAENPCAF
jgi:hypothetical protein